MAKSVASKILLIGFICGALGIIAFHQTTLLLLHYHAAKLPILIEYLGRAPAPYSFVPLPPFGQPSIVSLALWGGFWGIVLALLLRFVPLGEFFLGFVFGAAALTMASLFVGPGLIGQPLLEGASDQVWLRTALLNGAWGWGTVFLLRPFAVRG